MCFSPGSPLWLRSLLAVMVCLWLGIGPVLAASNLWEPEPECCCGGESLCLLAGCDCGGADSRSSNPCGGLRSTDAPGSTPTVLSFGLHLGLAANEISVHRLLPIGETEGGADLSLEPPVRLLEPPPPRFAAAR